MQAGDVGVRARGVTVQSGTQPGAVRIAAALAVLLAVLLAVMVVASGLGPARIPPAEVARIVLGAAVPGVAEAGTPAQQSIVLQVRLPRVVAGALVGAALSVSGATLQGLFRNPMADPAIIGVSGGAALGGVLAMVSGLYLLAPLSLPAMAFAGAALATAAVYGIARAVGQSSAATLVLTGMAVSSLVGACISLLITRSVYHLEVLQAIFFWLAGGLDARTWLHVRVAGPAILLGLAILVRYARALNLLTLGDEQARSLGVRVAATRRMLLAAAALATGAAVSISGTIGFVGLMMPHILRLLVSPDHRVLLPASALGGAAFLVAADTVARLAASPAELRVGVVTAFVGAPFFLFLLFRHRRHLGT